MSIDIRMRPGFEADVIRSPAVVAAARRRGERVAAEATRIGRQVASSYEAEVEVEGNTVRVGGSTRATQTHMNLGKSIEHGTWRKPATAPLRRGAEQVGLKTGPAQ